MSHEHHQEGGQSVQESSPTSAPATLAPITYAVVPFRKGGAAEEFSFTTKEYNTVDAAINDLGVTLLLDVLNAEIANRIGNKARIQAGFAGLGEQTSRDYPTKKAALVAGLVAKYPSKVIFSESDAQSWKPGERELTITGIQKKVTESYKLMAAATTPEDKQKHFAAMNAWLQQIVVASQRDVARAETV